MKKGLVVVIIAVIAVGGVAALVLANNNKKSSSTDTSTSGTTTNTGNNNSSNSPVATMAVSIKDMAFSPANITVKKGSTVTWTNNDGFTHTVTGDNGGPDSGDLASGKTYQFTFDTVGTFSYHCSIHSNMTGTVTVTE